MDLVFSTYYLAAPLVLIDLNANPIELGLVGTILSTAHMGMANLMGPLSDRLGRRRLIITAPVLFVASCLVMTMTRQIKVVLALSILNGLCMSLFWPAFQAWIADRQAGPELARDIGSFNMSWTAANLSGPVISAFLFSFYPRLPFLFAATISVILFLLTYTSLQDRKTQPVARIEPVDGETSTWQKRFLCAVWIANFISWFIIGNVRYQFPKLARDLNTAPYLIGLLIGCVGFAQFLGFSILRTSGRWHFKRIYLLGVQLLAAGGVLLILLSSKQALFALALIMIGLCASLTYYSSLYYAVHLIKRKGRGAGIHDSVV